MSSMLLNPVVNSQPYLTSTQLITTPSFLKRFLNLTVGATLNLLPLHSVTFVGVSEL